MRPGGDVKEDRDKKLFVGGLNPKTDDNCLREFYGQYGEITDVVVMKDPRSQKSRGFGFVTFKDSSAVDAAQASRPHHIDDKEVDSKRAMPRDENGPEVHTTVTKIFVGGLPKEATNEMLTQYFEQYGEIVDAQVVIKKETNTPRGFAFVSFDDHDSVDKVILNKPHIIGDKKVDVRKALGKEELQKARAKQQAAAYHQGWANGGGYQAGWDGGYNQSYAMPNYGYPGGAYGFGYEPSHAPMHPGWAATADGGFGNYQQQEYNGGPMRGGPQYSRPAPYQGQTWQQR